MKYASATLTALCAIVCLTGAPRVQADSGHGIRADLEYPFGPNELGDWVVPTSTPPNTFNSGVTSANAVTLSWQASSPFDTLTDFDSGVTFTSGLQYDLYAAPIPTAPFSGTGAPGPVTQVLAFTLAADQTFDTVALPTGGTEVEFNYDTSSSLVSGATGPASFTMGGVTYTSLGPGVPTSTLNTFFFNPDGSLFGAETQTSPGVFEVAVGAIASGWESSAGSTGGGGTVSSAPEIDPSSAASALTLLAGVLMVLLGARRIAAREA
jgi:hypothetical protein